MMPYATLRVADGSEDPPRFAKVEARAPLSKADASPCPCGARFLEHEWLLTIENTIGVIACSRKERRSTKGTNVGTHEQRAAELTPKATHITVDKMITFTTTEEGDVIVRICGNDGTAVATRVIPEIQWPHLRKVVH